MAWMNTRHAKTKLERRKRNIFTQFKKITLVLFISIPNYWQLQIRISNRIARLKGMSVNHWRPLIAHFMLDSGNQNVTELACDRAVSTIRRRFTRPSLTSFA